MIQNTINQLGLRATDKVTGFAGVITSVGFDLYGCVQAVVTPPLDKDGKTPESRWFDVQRLEVSKFRVMDVPEFESRDALPKNYDRGPADKPAFEVKP